MASRLAPRHFERCRVYTYRVDMLALRETGFTLALGGGGALGFAHIGVLREMEARDLKPRAVAGTSMGAIVAATWALLGPDALNDIPRLASESAFWLAVLSRGWTVRRQLRRVFGEATLGDCHVPVVVCAAPVNDPSQPLYLDDPKLSVWQALAASCSLPLAFSPVRVGGQRLMDGGSADNLPCAALRRFGLPVMGIELGFLHGALRDDREPRRRWIKMLARRGLCARYRDLGDFLLQPKLGGLTPQSFGAADRIVKAGVECVSEASGRGS